MPSRRRTGAACGHLAFRLVGRHANGGSWARHGPMVLLHSLGDGVKHLCDARTRLGGGFKVVEAMGRRVLLNLLKGEKGGGGEGEKKREREGGGGRERERKKI